MRFTKTKNNFGQLKYWHISWGSVIEIHFKTLINKHAALISANQCGALLFWLNYACFLSALIWTF